MCSAQVLLGNGTGRDICVEKWVGMKSVEKGVVVFIKNRTVP